ncbi:molybdenum cofactor guanylyltransferase [Alkalicoccus luteus]|uniref:Probable molybdenum cofactor guanylyltransferase n=1 Tax=Alkalicoccus luteus TaxID=1237094 RepID=A0A969PQ40_9BACI|nr:molybdenum cofactor guanylyltransferase [Alkalicoccus luteus]NJP36914.1 molybdenum cofactor guanylyltransferase [Alkalicoccus luteus]
MEVFTAGVLLAGGRSSRMGENKALLQIKGVTAAAMTERALQGTDEQLCISNDPNVERELGSPVFADKRPYEGPLAGLETAMEQTKAAWCIVAACDMPLISKEVVELLISRAHATAADAVVPEAGGRRQPLLAAYRRKLLPLISKCLDEEKRSMAALLNSIKVDTISEADMMEAGIKKETINQSFFNMNRPEEYEWILRRAEAEGDVTDE